MADVTCKILRVLDVFIQNVYSYRFSTGFLVLSRCKHFESVNRIVIPLEAVSVGFALWPLGKGRMHPLSFQSAESTAVSVLR